MVPDTHISFQKLGNEISQTTHKHFLSARAWIFFLRQPHYGFPVDQPS